MSRQRPPRSLALLGGRPVHGCRSGPAPTGVSRCAHRWDRPQATARHCGSVHPELRTRATEVFGWKLRPDQESVIDAVLEGRDALAVMPTGSGKSAIYQVAGLGLDGLVVVVSPLAGLAAARLGYVPALAAAATIFAVSALVLVLSPFRRAKLP